MNFSVATVALILLASQVRAADKDRLLPTSAAAKLEVRYNVDGQSLHVTIKNGSPLTLTAGTLVCDKYDSKLPKPSIASTGFPWCKGDEAGIYIYGRYKKCEYDARYLEFFEETVKSGKSKELYFELKDYQVPLVRCDITELRGREAKFWE